MAAHWIKNRDIRIADLSQLNKYTIGYPRGSVFDDYVKTVLQPKGYYSVEQVKLYPSPTEALIALQNRNVDLVFVDSVMLVNYQKSLNLRVSSSYQVSLPCGIGPRKAQRDDGPVDPIAIT